MGCEATCRPDWPTLSCRLKPLIYGHCRFSPDSPHHPDRGQGQDGASTVGHRHRAGPLAGPWSIPARCTAEWRSVSPTVKHSTALTGDERQRGPTQGRCHRPTPIGWPMEHQARVRAHSLHARTARPFSPSVPDGTARGYGTAEGRLWPVGRLLAGRWDQFDGHHGVRRRRSENCRLTGGRDGKVRLWDAAVGSVSRPARSKQELRDRRQSGTSPDGRMISATGFARPTPWCAVVGRQHRVGSIASAP